MTSYKRRRYKKDTHRIKARGKFLRSEPKCIGCVSGERSDRYPKQLWWLHRRCRVSSDKPFKKVIGISLYELRGSGIVKLVYDDRSVDMVGGINHSSCRVRKIDVEVEPGSKPRGVKVI